MEQSQDFCLMLPREHIEALSEVIFIGLQRAKIDPSIRRELQAWWEAEHDFIKEDLDKE